MTNYAGILFAVWRFPGVHHCVLGEQSCGQVYVLMRLLIRSNKKTEGSARLE